MIAVGGIITANTIFDLAELKSGIAAATISIGVIISLISFLGCFGAVNEKGILLKTYFAILAILVVLEIGVGIAAYVQRDQLDQKIGDTWATIAQRTDNKILTDIQDTVSLNSFFPP